MLLSLRIEGTNMSEILELAWLFCKRAKESRMDDDQIRWVLDQALERFDGFEALIKVSINEIRLEGKNEMGRGD